MAMGKRNGEHQEPIWIVASQLPEGERVLSPSIYLDGHFIGCVSERKPVLFLKRGNHTIRLECPGYKPWQGDVCILGGDNMQYLRVLLEKAGGRAPA